ncbi:hypothetical protein VI817_004320 [Penicillium citrinum]|nr:hypothetical protein VI817_004320 [Penicillium citrinum]
MFSGFSKSSSVLKVDRTEVIAKIPCRIGGPPSLTTAGEIGLKTVADQEPDQIRDTLSAIQFPVYGGLYLRTDIRGCTRPLGNDIHLSKSFQIGLSCDRAFDLDMLGSSTEGLVRHLRYIILYILHFSLENLLSSFVSSIA